MAADNSEKTLSTASGHVHAGGLPEEGLEKFSALIEDCGDEDEDDEE